MNSSLPKMRSFGWTQLGSGLTEVLQASSTCCLLLLNWRLRSMTQRSQVWWWARLVYQAGTPWPHPTPPDTSPSRLLRSPLLLSTVKSGPPLSP